jgi:hypothetical protein
MNKIIIAVVLIAIVAIMAVLMLPQLFSQEEAEVTAEESAILEDIYTEMLEEELNSIQGENYSSEMEDEMASDLSQFYYE